IQYTCKEAHNPDENRTIIGRRTNLRLAFVSASAFKTGAEERSCSNIVHELDKGLVFESIIFYLRC
ncbi:MAG: hypothetical protein KDK05_33140, partial [Candidatus Competibacteraceae bacterium]|nr:hypothetical protein [Candidatus Competibacteraceae bacterium]